MLVICKCQQQTSAFLNRAADRRTIPQHWSTKHVASDKNFYKKAEAEEEKKNIRSWIKPAWSVYRPKIMIIIGKMI